VPLAAASPIRRRACAIADGLRYRNRSGGCNGLLSWADSIDAPDFVAFCRQAQIRLADNPLADIRLPVPRRAKRLPAACGQSHGGGGPDGSGRRAFAHGIRALPGMFLPSSMVRSITPIAMSIAQRGVAPQPSAVRMPR
jgi:hypothetical protein